MTSLSNVVVTMSINDDPFKELGLSDEICSKLKIINNNYETIFSWNIKNKTGIRQNLVMNLVDEVSEKREFMIDEDTFNFNRY